MKKMPFGRKSPFDALALPGAILAYKYTQFRQKRREAASRRITEKELSALHHKIDKLLNKLEESDPEPPTSQEDECVICINARATMQTSPCGHRVVCRRCFVKTIQSAVAQRMLPLRCVICRARVNRLTSSSGSWRIQESASSYSVGGKSWSSYGSSGIQPSASSYSMGEHLSGNSNEKMHHRGHKSHKRFAQSSSLYSMSSGTSSLSSASTISNVTSCSNMSSQSIVSADSSASANSSTSSQYGINNHHNHSHSTCPIGCSGAIPRKPGMNTCPPTPSATNTYPGRRSNKSRLTDLHNRLPPIKEFRSPAKVPHPSPVHINNPRFRYASYTKSSNPLERAPLITDSSTSKKTLGVGASLKQGLSAKVSPAASKTIVQKNSLLLPSSTKENCNGIVHLKPNNNNSAKIKKVDTSSSNKKFPLFSNINKSNNSANNGNITNNISASNALNDEKADNKKNENAEKKKKDDKLKLKAEKEARKEEKRQAKEEERLAKMLAKEEKKKGRKETKELLLGSK